MAKFPDPTALGDGGRKTFDKPIRLNSQGVPIGYVPTSDGDGGTEWTEGGGGGNGAIVVIEYPFIKTWVTDHYTLAACCAIAYDNGGGLKNYVNLPGGAPGSPPASVYAFSFSGSPMIITPPSFSAGPPFSTEPAALYGSGMPYDFGFVGTENADIILGHLGTDYLTVICTTSRRAALIGEFAGAGITVDLEIPNVFISNGAGNDYNFNLSAITGAGAALWGGDGVNGERTTVKNQIDFQKSVISKIVTDPSTLTPVEFDRYLIPVSATGIWLSKPNQIAEWGGDPLDWVFTVLDAGATVYVEDEGRYYTFDGSNWFPLEVTLTQSMAFTWGSEVVTENNEQVLNYGGVPYGPVLPETGFIRAVSTKSMTSTGYSVKWVGTLSGDLYELTVPNGQTKASISGLTIAVQQDEIIDCVISGGLTVLQINATAEISW